MKFEEVSTMFQKVLVLVTQNLVAFSDGIVYGQIACLVGALQRRDEGLDFSEAQISLIASSLVIMNIFGFGLGAIIADKFGRRWAYIIFSILIIVNWTVLYKATEMYQFMLSRVIAGIAVGALWNLNIFVTAEYASPKTRPFYLNMVTTVTPAIGSLLVHALGLILHWRVVTLISIIPAASGVLLPFFWVESPHWLASKWRFEECQTAFRKLHGSTTNSERELELLLKLERSKFKKVVETNTEPTYKRLLLAFKKKYFWGLLFMTVVMHAYNAAGGKVAFMSLATVMLAEITGTPDVLLYTLFVDGCIILGSCMSLFLIRNTSMRTLLFSTGYTANTVLVIFSACFYFKNGENYFNWINVSLLALYFILVNAGPYPLFDAIFSEMFPVELKMYIFFISGIVLIGSLSLAIFLLPFMVSSMGYHGLFLLNAAIMTLSLSYLWVKLPETKGRTLQETEVYYRANNFNVDEVLSKEQSNALIV